MKHLAIIGLFLFAWGCTQKSKRELELRNEEKPGWVKEVESNLSEEEREERRNERTRRVPSGQCFESIKDRLYRHDDLNRQSAESFEPYVRLGCKGTGNSTQDRNLRSGVGMHEISDTARQAIDHCAKLTTRACQELERTNRWANQPCDGSEGYRQPICDRAVSSDGFCQHCFPPSEGRIRPGVR